MIKENKTSSLQGSTSVLELEYSISKHQSKQSDTNPKALLMCCVNNNVEKVMRHRNEKCVREIEERSKLNERRGRKSRNLFAVDAYNRRSKERRLNLDISAV